MGKGEEYRGVLPAQLLDEVRDLHMVQLGHVSSVEGNSFLLWASPAGL